MFIPNSHRDKLLPRSALDFPSHLTNLQSSVTLSPQYLFPLDKTKSPTPHFPSHKFIPAPTSTSQLFALVPTLSSQHLFPLNKAPTSRLLVPTPASALQLVTPLPLYFPSTYSYQTMRRRQGYFQLSLQLINLLHQLSLPHTKIVPATTLSSQHLFPPNKISVLMLKPSLQSVSVSPSPKKLSTPLPSYLHNTSSQ